jgi:hypothetical protein
MIDSKEQTEFEGHIMSGQASPGINLHVGKIMDTKWTLFDQFKDLCKSFLSAAVLLEGTARLKVQCTNAEHDGVENFTIRGIKRAVDKDTVDWI